MRHLVLQMWKIYLKYNVFPSQPAVTAVAKLQRTGEMNSFSNSVSFSGSDKHYPYPSPATRAEFTQVAQGDLMILSPAKGVRGGHRNGFVLHLWPRGLREILQIGRHTYIVTSIDFHLMSICFLRFQLESW